MTAVASRLGENQRRILHLKRRGSSTIPAIADDLRLNGETVRTPPPVPGSDGLLVHVSGEALEEVALAIREKRLCDRRKVIDDLGASANHGQGRVLADFFEERVEHRRAAALARVEGLEGDERFDEVARVLSEEGFVAGVRNRPKRQARAAAVPKWHVPFQSRMDIDRYGGHRAREIGSSGCVREKPRDPRA